MQQAVALAQQREKRLEFALQRNGFVTASFVRRQPQLSKIVVDLILDASDALHCEAAQQRLFLLLFPSFFQRWGVPEQRRDGPRAPVNDPGGRRRGRISAPEAKRQCPVFKQGRDAHIVDNNYNMYVQSTRR